MTIMWEFFSDPYVENGGIFSQVSFYYLGNFKMGLHHWQCRASGNSNILCTKRKQSGKDSVIEGQPLLLSM
jgi:hypothetical protein